MSHKVDNITRSDRFKHLFTLSYDDIIPFVFQYIKKHTFPLVLAWSLLLAMIIWMLDFRLAMAGNFRFTSIFLHSLLGFIVLPVILVIPHELLHVIPYFLGGARNIRIGANWSQFYFYVSSHLQPVGPFIFISVALTPFLLVSGGLLYLVSVIHSPLWSWSIMCTLFMHTTMCAGDFALINFYWINRDKKIITWDDTNRKESYFYEELKEEQKI